MGKSVLLEILNSPDTKKGAAHRAAPLADSPTSCPLSTESKKTLPPSSRKTRFVSDALLIIWATVIGAIAVLRRGLPDAHHLPVRSDCGVHPSPMRHPSPSFPALQVPREGQLLSGGRWVSRSDPR